MISDVKPGEKIVYERLVSQRTKTGTLVCMTRFQGHRYARVKVAGERTQTIDRNRIISKVSFRELALRSTRGGW